MTAHTSDTESQRVLVADHSTPVRQELCGFLGLVPGIEVIGQAAGIADAVRLVSALRPDAVLLDLDMEGIDGYRAASLIRRQLPRCRLIGMSVHGLEEERERALRAGFDFFVTKGAPLEALLEAILGAPAHPISSSGPPSNSRRSQEGGAQ